MNFKYFFILTALVISIECCAKCRLKSNTTQHTVVKNGLSNGPTVKSFFKVVKVADGDTITVYNYSNKDTTRIRFMCIDAPEKSQDKWGDLALKKLIELLPLNTNVTLEGSSHDLYNRTISQVINNKGVNINKKMMELGLVVMYPSQKGCNDFKDIELAAKKAKKGVWSDSKFEMPWDYRKRNGIGFRGHGKEHDDNKKGHHFHHNKNNTTKNSQTQKRI